MIITQAWEGASHLGIKEVFALGPEKGAALFFTPKGEKEWRYFTPEYVKTQERPKV